MTDEAVAPRIRVGRVSRSQIDEAARILALAFADEKMFAYLLGADRDRRVRALVPYFRSVVGSFLLFGEVHSAHLGDHLAGVAVRVPPGRWPLNGLWQLRVLLGHLPGLARMIMTCPRAHRLLRLGQALEAGQPRGRPYWYLMYVGVDPTFRRRGIGSRLAREVIDRADAAGVGCYLETAGEATVALYRRHGFEVLEEARPLADGPLGWRLWRDPQLAAAQQRGQATP